MVMGANCNFADRWVCVYILVQAVMKVSFWHAADLYSSIFIAARLPFPKVRIWSHSAH
jgi:hypothetical protein